MRPTSRAGAPLRLCVLGWFGHRNGGDDRIAEVLVRSMEGCHLTFLPFVPLPPEVVHYFDGVVLTAGVWHPRNRLARDFHRWCRQVHVPIAAVGLGVEEVTAATRAASDALVERSVYLWVRDADSKRMLGDHPKIVVGPDVTWAAPLEPCDERAAEGIALNLRSWQREDWQPDGWVNAAQRVAAPACVVPWSFGPEDWILLHRFFPGCAKNVDAAAGGRAEVVVGMRLHSLIFAAQMAVPPVGIVYDPKCRRFLEALERPHWALDLAEPMRLADTVGAIRERPSEERKELLARRAEWTRAAGGLLGDAIQAIASAAGRRRRAPSSRVLLWLGRRLLAAGFARQTPRR